MTYGGATMFGGGGIIGKQHLLVAAADSPAKFKAAADYCCDGTDDQEEIWRAFAATSNKLNSTYLGLFGIATTTTGYPSGFYDAADVGKEYKILKYQYLYYSADGLTWSDENRYVTQNGSLVAGCAWRDGNWYYQLTKGGTGFLLKTMPADGSWTWQNAGEVFSKEASSWEDESGLDPTGVIVVDGTLYVYFNTVDSINPRKTGVASITYSELCNPDDDMETGDGVGTNPTNFTRGSDNPIFINNRFCPTVFKLSDDKYYMIICHFTGHHHAKNGHHGYEEFEVYRCATPDFSPDTTEFVGVLYQLPYALDTTGTNICNADTPYVWPTTIARDTFTTDTLIVGYHATNKDRSVFYTHGLSVPFTELTGTKAGWRGGEVRIAPGTYHLNNPIIPAENSVCHAHGAKFLIYDSTFHATNKAGFLPGAKSKFYGGEMICMYGDTNETWYGILHTNRSGEDFLIDGLKSHGFYKHSLEGKRGRLILEMNRCGEFTIWKNAEDYHISGRFIENGNIAHCNGRRIIFDDIYVINPKGRYTVNSISAELWINANARSCVVKRIRGFTSKTNMVWVRGDQYHIVSENHITGGTNGVKEEAGYSTNVLENNMAFEV